MYFCSFGIRLSVKPSRSQILSDQEFKKPPPRLAPILMRLPRNVPLSMGKIVQHITAVLGILQPLPDTKATSGSASDRDHSQFDPRSAASAKDP